MPANIGDVYEARHTDFGLFSEFQVVVQSWDAFSPNDAHGQIVEGEPGFLRVCIDPDGDDFGIEGACADPSFGDGAWSLDPEADLGLDPLSWTTEAHGQLDWVDGEGDSFKLSTNNLPPA